MLGRKPLSHLHRGLLCTLEQTITTVFSPPICDTFIAVKWIRGNQAHDREHFDKVTKFSLILFHSVPSSIYETSIDIERVKKNKQTFLCSYS